MDEQQMIQALAQVYMQQTGEQDPNKAMQTVVQIVQAAQQGDQQATQMLQQLVQIAQGGGQQQTAAPQMARHGAKLNFIKSLRGECPEGTEMTYFKKGGVICKKCAKKQEIAEEKCGGKVKKAESGTKAVKDFKNSRNEKKKSNKKEPKKEPKVITNDSNRKDAPKYRLGEGKNPDAPAWMND